VCESFFPGLFFPLFYSKLTFISDSLISLQMAPDYDHLMLMQKVEVFEHALEHTQGDDLAKILWYKSPSSEVS
jgi:phosphatidylinositol kinase/protein kinase (PI-3  family)